jgi:DNA-binding NtrC family response regulator
MRSEARILLIEDDLGAATSLKRLLQAEGYQVQIVENGLEGIRIAQSHPPDVVITDWRLPGADGITVVQELHRVLPQLPIILITAHGSTDTAIEATKHGAFEYLVKPLDMEELLEAVHRGIEHHRRTAQPIELGSPTTSRDTIVGQCRVMRDIYKEIGRVAAQPVDVLIRGETGTGKELVARAIYQYSNRVKNPFITVNCAAIPENLLESELFGHERGAFTGATVRRIGRFEQANGGTLLLDEIGDLTLFTQAKLLRVLQERVITRVGGNETIQIDVRVIAATHRDLESMIAEKLFREDLFYRLSQFTIALPTLRQRQEDLPLLVKYFGERFGHDLGIHNPSFTAGAVQILATQPWPGNVRQLANVIRQCLLVSRGPVSPEHVQSILTKKETATSSDHTTTPLSELAAEFLEESRESGSDDAHARLIAEAERALLSRAMTAAKGNKTQAAKWLGITRVTLREKLNGLGLGNDV